MQDLLTVVFDATAILAILWLFTDFVTYAWHRSQPLVSPTNRPAETVSVLVPPLLALELPLKPSSPETQAIAPFPQPVFRNLPPQPLSSNPPNIRVLREECNRLGIKWRNANGKNKHLTRTEIIERLAVLST